MKRKGSVLLVSAVLTAVVAGCGEGSTVGNKTSAESSNVVASSSVALNATERGFQITLGNGLVETLPTPQACNMFRDLVESNSEGKISVEVYHNQQLGGDRELVEATQMNNVQMCPPSSTPYCNFVSEFYVWDVPFLFKDYEQVQKMYDNKELLEKYNQISIEKAGIRVLSYWMNGFRNVTCNGEKRTPDDFKGMKIRTMENDLHLATWKSIGANPTPMAFGEVYTALQQRTIDAQENPNNTNFETRYNEVCDTCVQTKHIYTPYPMLINESFYQSLPEDLRQVVTDAANKAGAYEIELSISKDEEYKKKLEEAGCSVIELTEEERQLFIDKVTEGGIQEMAKEKSGNPELSEEFFDAVNEL